MALVRLFFTYKKSKKKNKNNAGSPCGNKLRFFCTYVHFVLAQNISV